MKGQNIAYIVVGVCVFLLLVWLAFPVIRYLAVPISGSASVPDVSYFKGEQPQKIEPGLLSDGEKMVASVDEVKSQGGWINSTPLNLEVLLSQKMAILIDFWTYSCINCVRATPYTQELWERYKDYGLVVIGVHSPEFAFEKDPQNIVRAIKKAGITYPVVLDGDKEIWKSFDNHFWPAKYLIVPPGKIVYTHFGEGSYEAEEKTVVSELQKLGWKPPQYGPPSKFLELSSEKTTPELYAGPAFLRRSFGNQQQPKLGEKTTYQLPKQILPDRIYLEGTWEATREAVLSVTQGKVILSFLGNSLYVVLAPKDKPVIVEVLLDGHVVPENARGADIQEKEGKTVMVVDTPRLYFPFSHFLPSGRKELTLVVPPGLELYSFTFGAYQRSLKS